MSLNPSQFWQYGQPGQEAFEKMLKVANEEGIELKAEDLENGKFKVCKASNLSRQEIQEVFFKNTTYTGWVPRVSELADRLGNRVVELVVPEGTSRAALLALNAARRMPALEARLAYENWDSIPHEVAFDPSSYLFPSMEGLNPLPTPPLEAYENWDSIAHEAAFNLSSYLFPSMEGLNPLPTPPIPLRRSNIAENGANSVRRPPRDRGIDR